MARAKKPPPSRAVMLYYRCTYAGAVLLGWLIRPIPIDWWVALGGHFGALAHRFDRERRQRARRNLRETLGAELPARRRKAIVREMYRNMGRLGFEYVLLASGRNLRPWSRWIEPEGDVVEQARAALEEYGAVIFVTCHGGSFDLLGAWASEELAPLQVVVKDIRNPFFNERILAMRHGMGMGTINKFPALRTILRELRAGNSVAMICDQRRTRRGLIVRFFGREAASIDTPAVLALRYGLPIVPGFSYRVGRGMHYRATMDTVILPDPNAPKDEEVVRLTQAVNDAIERFVRAHPEQWNWTQPRWKITRKMRRRARRRAGDARSAPGGAARAPGAAPSGSHPS